MKKVARKAFYAMVGAPVVARDRLMDMSAKLTDGAKTEFDAWAKEGEKVTKKVRSSDMVEEFTSRVDLDHLQGRVEKLRDQLEDALSSWRESFKPEEDKDMTTKVVAKPAAKPAAKAPAARKPAVKKPAAKTTTTRKAPAKKPAAKTTTTRKAPAAKKAAATSKS